jgi:protocatechuate 3,4-dioxygenase alpha subunit
MSTATPSQTVGPFFSFGLVDANLVVAPGDAEPLRIEGRVLDGAGAGVPDAVVEILAPAGFGRCLTTADGGYRFVVSKPPAVDHPDGTVEAPHLEMSVFARGLLQRVATRLYFPDEPANDADPVLASIADAAVRATLVARSHDGSVGFDVHLQGPEETAFFAL